MNTSVDIWGYYTTNTQQVVGPLYTPFKTLKYIIQFNCFLFLNFSKGLHEPLPTMNSQAEKYVLNGKGGLDVSSMACAG